MKELIQAIEKESLTAVDYGFRAKVIPVSEVIDLINTHMAGKVIVPVEPKFPRFHVHIEAVIDYMKPPLGPAESCQRDSAQAHLSHIAFKLEPQVKELVYKAMLSTIGEQDA